MNIIKRSGEEQIFDSSKIVKALESANSAVDVSESLTSEEINKIVKKVCTKCKSFKRAVQVEEVQDLVETELMKTKHYELAKRYITYRYDRAKRRQLSEVNKRVLTLLDNKNEDLKQENSNKNVTISSTQRDYMAGEVSKDISRNILLPKEVVKAHDDGLIHIHDLDYFAMHIHNCELVNLEDMLQNGTVISGTKIDTPHSFSTACNITTQIIAQVCSNSYGGQSISFTHLAPFIQVSRNKIRREVLEEFQTLGIEIDHKKFKELVDKRLKEEITRGIQTIQYQVVTIQTTNGQAPFITFFMYLSEARSEIEKEDLALIIEEVLKQRLEGTKNELGVRVTPAFPKLIYVLEEDNITPGSKYWYLTELAAKCSAKRLVPDYISEKMMKSWKLDNNGVGHCYVCMGCRSFLTPDREAKGFNNIANAKNYDGKSKYYGRFNQGVCTINLPYVALLCKRDLNKFWDCLESCTELCHKALRCRHERLLGTPSDASPILWQYGALARLKKGEKIDKLLYNGYSTISLGYCGLWETVYALIGKKLTEPEGIELANKILDKLNSITCKWRAAENIDYSLYGTPLETSTYRLAKALQKKFGVIPGVSDKSYITNSYHIHVTEPVSAFTKLKLEAALQLKSPGGCISYVEVPNLQNNIEAVLSILRFIYDNIVYAEINTKSDYCMNCNYDGEITTVRNKQGKLIWKCPRCGNTDESKMSVVRRTCGYLGSNFWNAGRTEEIHDRVLHL